MEERVSVYVKQPNQYKKILGLKKIELFILVFNLWQ